MTPSEQNRLTVIQKVYEQQKYMYDNRTHSVPDRIVSLSQPWVRPIVRGKAGKPVEFGVRLPSISCLSYNKRSNWLTNVYLGFLCPLFRLLAILLLQRSI